MGTYLQGVESIIPSLQPYDNGLNVVSNLLQLKQSQYDTNYAQLGKMYGQYYYGDLTREDNIKKRDNTVSDEILKIILAKQCSDHERVAGSNIIIYTCGSKNSVKKQVKKFLRSLTNKNE